MNFDAHQFFLIVPTHQGPPVPANATPAYASHNPDTAVTALPTPRTSVQLGATAPASSPDTYLPFALLLPALVVLLNCALAPPPELPLLCPPLFPHAPCSATAQRPRSDRAATAQRPRSDRAATAQRPPRPGITQGRSGFRP